MLRTNLISWDNGVGLSRDLALIGAALGADADFAVSYTKRGRGKLRKYGRPVKVFAQSCWKAAQRWFGAEPFDFNIELEHIWPEYASWARRTVLVPNPEWFNPRDIAVLGQVGLVLAKTRMAESLFNGLGCPTAYIGFTSPDRLDRGVPRERAFFHLAGRSRNKGTAALMALWQAHPQWPRLTVVQSPRVAKTVVKAGNIEHRVGYVSDDELKRLQNSHRFHLCPSETEGFGHYLVEAMSVGAVTLTMDAAPMNELVRPDRGILVPFARTGTQGLATTHYFDPPVMEAAIEAMLALDEAELARCGDAARRWYEANDAAFAPRLRQVLKAAATHGVG